MESLYLPVKNTHLFFVTMTFILFNLRFWLRTMRPEKPLPLVLKVIPHINDSMLLFTGMLMMQIVPWQPFGANKWLGVKLLLVVGYIVSGIFCLRSQPKTTKWWAFYGLSISLIAVIAYLAKMKPI